MVARRACLAVAAVVALLASPFRVEAHPLHTTLTEVAASDRSIRATVRLFADDLASAAGRGVVSSDAGVDAYVASRFALFDGTSHPLPTRSCGVKRSGELLWICLEASYAGSAVSLRNALLCEAFKDQLNIVQTSLDGAKHSIVFTRGDGAKRIF